MNLSLIKYSLASMKTRKLRSWLTIVSVFIGITALTALISFGMGISAYVEEVSQKMGDDKLIIQPRGFGFGPPSPDTNVKLDESDLETVRGVNGIKEATGVIITTGEITFHNQKKYANILGSDYEHYPQLIKEVYTLNLLNGHELTGREKNKAVLGYNYKVKDRIFGRQLTSRDTLTVNGHDIKIAGFYEEVGNPHDDAHLYMNVDAVKDLFGREDYYFILVRAAPGRNPSKLAEDIREKLRNHRHQSTGNEDFFVQTFEQVIATFTSVLTSITIVVILIAFISLVVAAVNIMNTMYASILERTQEIGVFKAIGAKNRDIMLIFIMEAGLLSSAGGFLGVLAGYGIAKYAGNMISSAGYAIFTPLFPWQLIIGSLAFACIIGILSGLMPAYRASQLKPVDALRYE